MTDVRVSAGHNAVGLFLDGARVVSEALADPEVVARWDQPSVLEDQTVGGLAGHLARGGVWVVGDYLDGGEPPGPVRFESAGEYFATLVSALTEQDNAAIRERGAAVAAGGPDDVLSTLDGRRAALEQKLPHLPPDRRIAVTGGYVMRLGDYLLTRIVEQTVHLDDLARSVELEGWRVHPDAERLTIQVGLEVGWRRHGAGAMIRALYRTGYAEAALPVM